MVDLSDAAHQGLQSRPRIIETRLLDPSETAKLWLHWSETYSVLGLFKTCPLHEQTQLVLHRVRNGKEERMHLRPWEIQHALDSGAVKIVGWCYAPSWDHLRRYASAVLKIELPDQPEE